ncbi:MAG TPA: ATP-binding protein [Thermoplasmata archaeon]|nr:ATP-binding protein [Thermoplasmata archaeon]
MRGPREWHLLPTGWILAALAVLLLVGWLAVLPVPRPLTVEDAIAWLGPPSFLLLLILTLGVLLGRAERVNEQGDEASRLLLDVARGTILLVGSDRIIQYVNRGITAVFGYAPNEVVGRPLGDLLDGAELEALWGALDDRIGPEGRTVRPITGRRKDGSTVPLEATGRRARVPGGTGAAIHLKDMSERDELVRAVADRAAQLARSNRDLEQFAYVASHDLQEPLRMVASYTQLLRERYRGRALDADAEEFLGYATEGAERMRGMIDNLLAFSRLETRGRPFEPISMEEVLSTALQNLAPAIRASGGRVDHEPLPDLVGDASQLVQLFQNLIANALKFRGPTPPEIQISAVRKPSEWLFSVRDNGLGIAPSDQERVFVLFQRLHSRSEYPGSGIGLSTCRKVVERHGGRLWVESRGIPGDGSDFRFTLPAGNASTLRPPSLEARPQESSRAEEARTLIEERLSELI